MLDITSKCRVGLRVTTQHLCVSKENEGGFSPGYVLLSFQNLTPSSRQSRLTTLTWTKATPTSCMQSEENHPYNGGWLKIGSVRIGGMNQNTPNPGLTLRWPNSSLVHPLNGVKRLSPNNLRPRVELDTLVWLSVRDGDGRSHLLTEALCLIPKESAWQRLWEKLKNQTDSRCK